MSDSDRAIKASDILDVYRVWEKTPDLNPDIFQSVSFAYWTRRQDAAGKAASMYVSQGQDRTVDMPIGNEEYITGLFDLALRQPRNSSVCRAAAMAVGLSTIPDLELGKMTSEERYLALHLTAQLAQNETVLIGRELIAMAKKDKPYPSILNPLNVIVFFGVLAAFWVAFGSG